MLPFQGADFFILFSQNITIFPKASPLHGFAVGLICVGLSARMNICYKSPAVFSNRKYSRFLIPPLIVLLNKIRSFVFQFWNFGFTFVFILYSHLYPSYRYSFRSAFVSYPVRIRFAFVSYPVRIRFECGSNA